MSYRGGGSGRGRGRHYGGRSSSGGRGGGSHGPPGERAHAILCRNFLNPRVGCTHRNCNFCHGITFHTEITCSNVDNTSNSNSNSNSGYNSRGYSGQSNSNQRKLYETTDVALWNDPSNNCLKIFTASHDGHWRLYNSGNNFSKEFEHNMNGKINKVMVASNFLFCAFDGVSVKVPNVTVGMIHAWNLSSPGEPPIELCMYDSAPYAHTLGVTCFTTKDDMCFSGGRDGAIRIWKYDHTMNASKGGFKIMKTCFGHAGDVTGLLMVGTMLWSSSTDGTIRLWDSNSNWECKYLISANTVGNATSPAPLTPTNGQSPEQGKGVGHSDAITNLVLFESPAGNFVLSSSLDGNIKAWNSTNGECVSTTGCRSGIVCMEQTKDTKGNDLLMIGTVDGKIMFRTLQQTAKVPPMHYVCAISPNFTNCGHTGPIRSIVSGPSNTFYSAGSDGKLMVWQIVGDFNL